MKRLLLYPMLLLGLVSLAFSGNIIISNNGIQINGSNVCLVGGSYTFGDLTVTSLNGYSIAQFLSSSGNSSCPEGVICVSSGNYTDFKSKLENAADDSTIYIPVGYYSGAGLTIVNKSNIYIYGAGINTVFDVTSGDGLDFKNSVNVTVKDFVIRNSDYGIEFEGVESSLIEGMTLDRCSASCIYMNGNEDEDSLIADGAWEYRTRYSTARLNTIIDYGGNGIETFYTEDILIEFNTVYCSTIACFGSGAREVGILGYTPTRNTFRGNIVGKYYNSSGALIGTPEDSMQMHCDGHTFGIDCNDNIIENNHLYGGGRYNDAMCLLVNNHMNHTVVENNNMYYCGCGSEVDFPCVETSTGDGNSFKTSESAENTFLVNNYAHVASGKLFNPGNPSTGLALGNFCYDEDDDCFSSYKGNWTYKNNFDMTNKSFIYE